MQVYIDIETIPQQPELDVKQRIAETIQPPATMSKPETIAEWMEGRGKYEGVRDALIEEKYRKTALDGAKGQICSIAWAVEDGEIHSYTANGAGRDERALLLLFFSELREELKGRPPQFVGHNVGGFDLRFLFQRAVILGIDPGFDIGQWGRHGSQFFDTMLAWAGYGGFISLSDLCAALGIQDDDQISGADVWDCYKAGKFDLIAQHNIADVRKVRTVARRLQFLG